MWWMAGGRVASVVVPRLAFTAARRCTTKASGHAKGEYSTDKETHFGFEHVSEEEKAQKGTCSYPLVRLPVFSSTIPESNFFC